MLLRQRCPNFKKKLQGNLSNAQLCLQNISNFDRFYGKILKPIKGFSRKLKVEGNKLKQSAIDNIEMYGRRGWASPRAFNGQMLIQETLTSAFQYILSNKEKNFRYEDRAFYMYCPHQFSLYIIYNIITLSKGVEVSIILQRYI